MRHLIVFCALIMTTQVFGQKYKDVHPLLLKAKENEALSMLKSYISTDLDNPNANLKLAEIYERRYKSSDPITEYAKAMANANEAKLRFTKAAALVTEKEVNRNTGYYANYASSFDSKGRPLVDFSTINSKIRAGYDSAQQFTQVIPQLYAHFTKSVDYHDRAIKNYNSLNGDFNSRDKLLLLYNAEVEADLQQLISDYDSSIYYLNQYLAQGKSYDAKHFNQTYAVNDIETYRLQGLLTSPSFLVKNIVIWNYKQWAQDIMDEVKNEVSPLRTRIQKAELDINAAIKETNPLVRQDAFTPFKMDNKLLYELTKYDRGSLPLSVLKFKQQKHRLNYQLGLINDRDTTANNDTYLVQLGELLYQAKATDSTLAIVKKRATDENIGKYENYFRTHYQGASGLNDMIKDEELIIRSASNKAVSRISDVLAGNGHTNREYATYRKLKVPLFTSELHLDSVTSQPLTTHIQANADGSTYLAGVVKSGDHILTFMSKTDTGNRVLWYKQFTLIENAEGNVTHETGGMAITPEGCGTLVRIKTASGLSNRLLYVNEAGDEIFNKELDLPLYPRSMKYVERTNSFIQVYKGVTRGVDFKENNDAHLLNINILGDVLWSQQLAYSGEVVDLLILDKGFLLVGNYSEIKDESGQTYRTKVNNGSINGFVAQFDKTGKVGKIKALESPDSYRLTSVFKVNDKVINLLGASGSFSELAENDVHLITNSGTELIYSSL